MLKELKRKFILINMLLVGIVIVSIFTSVCLITYFSQENEINTLLEESLLARDVNVYIPDHLSEKTFKYAHVFTVRLNDTGEIIVSNTEDIDKEFVKSAVKQAWAKEESSGIIRSLDLSYMKTDTMAGTLISFVSRENLHARVKHSITVCGIAGMISLLLFFYISKHLADISMAPVERAWKQQKQFIADASHDLKTPLTVILANNEILSSHSDLPISSQMKWVESTDEEAKRMSQLVNQLLELAKSEDVKQELSFSDTNISELCDGAILQFEVVAFEKNVSIESNIAPSIIAKTHKETLSRVLEILFDNAIKYSPPNERITVNLYQTSQQIHFSIQNFGEVISEDDLPHIFERFYRTDKAREVGGHGLGLSIAQKLCEMISCKISVESDELLGTIFTVSMKNK